LGRERVVLNGDIEEEKITLTEDIKVKE